MVGAFTVSTPVSTNTENPLFHLCLIPSCRSTDDRPAPELQTTVPRVPAQFHFLTAPRTTRSFPLAMPR